MPGIAQERRVAPSAAGAGTAWATRRRRRFLLLALVAAGLAVRVWHAAYGLEEGRFEDERYSLQNIHSIVVGGTLAPASTYYPYPFFNLPPAALVAASRQLFDATGVAALATWDAAGRPLAATYFLCRLVQCLFGALGIWLLYRLGRALFAPGVALLAAATLAFLPWHIHASAYFKPDAQVTAMVLLALLLALRALRRGSLGAHALAGLAIALAMSSKLTGGVAAGSLAVGAGLALVAWWVRERRADPGGWRRPLLGLGVAGVTSAAAFVALNPYWAAYRSWLQSLGRDYAMRAGWQDATRLDVPWRVVEFLADGYALGAVPATAAILGSVMLAVAAARGARSDPRRSIALAVLLSFPVLYTASYAAQTAYFKANNFLPVLPLACLAMAWLVVAARRAAVRRWPTPARGVPLLAELAVAFLLATIVARGWLYAYRTVTPTTEDAAHELVNERLAARSGRLVVGESLPEADPPWFRSRLHRRGRAALLEVRRLADEPPSWLARSDAEIFLRSRLDGSTASFYRGRMQGLPAGRAQTFEPRLFRLRGPALVVVRHPWALRRKPEPLAPSSCPGERRCVRIGVGAAAGETVSVGLWIKLRRGGATGEAWLEHVATRVPMHLAGREAQGAEFVSERFALPAGRSEVALRWDGESARGRPAVLLYRWRDPGR